MASSLENALSLFVTDENKEMYQEYLDGKVVALSTFESTKFLDSTEHKQHKFRFFIGGVHHCLTRTNDPDSYDYDYGLEIEQFNVLDFLKADEIIPIQMGIMMQTLWNDKIIEIDESEDFNEAKTYIYYKDQVFYHKYTKITELNLSDIIDLLLCIFTDVEYYKIVDSIN